MHEWQINLKGHPVITVVMKTEQLLHLSQSEYLKESKADAWINVMVWESKNKLLDSGIYLIS